MDYEEDFGLEETNVEDYDGSADQQADGSDSEGEDNDNFEEFNTRLSEQDLIERTGDDMCANTDIQQYAFTKLVAERAMAISGGALTILQNSVWRSLPDRQPETIAAYELIHHKDEFPLDVVVKFGNGFVEYLEMCKSDLDHHLF